MSFLGVAFPACCCKADELRVNWLVLLLRMPWGQNPWLSRGVRSFENLLLIIGYSVTCLVCRCTGMSRTPVFVVPVGYSEDTGKGLARVCCLPGAKRMPVSW